MRSRLVLVALIAAAWAPAARACGIESTPAYGSSPLRVTYTADCDAASYHWDFGDGATADGKTVTHAYAAGRFGGSMTTDTETTALPRVLSVKIALEAPRSGDYRAPVTLSGTAAPGPARVRIYRNGVYVTSARSDARGRFSIRTRLVGPGPYTAWALGISSRPTRILVRPQLEARLVGEQRVGRPLAVVARLRPAAAGTVRLRVGAEVRKGDRLRVRIATKSARNLRVRVETVPASGYAKAARTLDVAVVYPNLGPGSTGASVRELERRLATLHYALAGLGESYAADTADAVTASAVSAP